MRRGAMRGGAMRRRLQLQLLQFVGLLPHLLMVAHTSDIVTRENNSDRRVPVSTRRMPQAVWR